MESLETLRKQVEKETAHGLSWDTAVQLRTIQELTEVSSRLEALNKVLSEILSDSRRLSGSSAEITDARSTSPSTSPPKRAGRTPGRKAQDRGTDTER